MTDCEEEKRSPEPPVPVPVRHDVAVYGGSNAVVKVLGDWCKGCGICVEVCAKKCLALAGDVATVPNVEACNRCLLCQLLCPDFAIVVLEPGAWTTWSREEKNHGCG
jgi:2-oxoglutarate ferredoxin oxidoreductase subunit delta